MSSAEMSSRSLTATLLGVLAGAGGFGALMLAGWLLYRRLWGDSATALLVIVVIFGAAGLYAGDIMITVDGRSIAGSNLDTVIFWVRGEAGTTVVLRRKLRAAVPA